MLYVFNVLHTQNKNIFHNEATKNKKKLKYKYYKLYGATETDEKKEIKIFNKKRRKRYQKESGHRQNLTQVKIEAINA